MLACLSAIPAQGQIELKKHTKKLAGEKALIREWLDTVSISYLVTPDGKKYFVQDIRGHSTAIAASVSPNMTVTDMEIISEYLYFCGQYDTLGTTYGIVGVLNIPNTFLWAQPYHIGLLNWVNNDHGGNIRMTNPQRVGASWNNYSSSLYISVVGDVEIKGPAGNYSAQTGVCDVTTDPTLSSWECAYYWCDDPDIVFTDITETDKYYVAVGRHDTRGTTLVKPFYSPSPYNTFTHPFTDDYVNSGYIDEITDDITEGSVLTVAEIGDKFSLVNYYRNAASAGSTVKLINVQPSTPPPVTPVTNIIQSIKLQQSNTPTVSPNWNLREIQYDDQSGWTFVLQDMDYPVNFSVTSTVCEYNLSPSAPSSGLFTLPGYPAHGIGSWSGGGFQTIGDNSGMLTYLRKKGGQNSLCEISNEHYYDTSQPDDVPLPILEYSTKYYRIKYVQYQEDLRNIKLIYDCIEY